MCVRCLEDVCRVPGGCLKGVWKVLGVRNLSGMFSKVYACCKEGSGEYKESKLKARSSQDMCSQDR